MSKSHGNVVWKLAGLAAVCLVVVIVGSRYLKGARVTGDTPEDRIASVIKLADDRPRGFADALVDTVRNDPDASVRRVALVCLNRSRRPSDRDAIEAATHDDDPRVRRAASRSLMAYDDEATVRRLTAICHDDAESDVRNAALIALTVIDSPHAIVTLIDMMENADTRELQLGAAEAMIDKFNVAVAPEPDDQQKWDDLLNGFKLDEDVAAAFRQTNTPLHVDEAARARILGGHASVCTHEPADGRMSGQPLRIEP